MRYHPSIRDVNSGTNGLTEGSITSESCLAAIV